MLSARQTIREGPFQRLFCSVCLSPLSGTWKLGPWRLKKLVRVSLPTDSYQRFAGIRHHRGRMSWVLRSRKYTSCIPRSLLHVYHTQTRPNVQHLSLPHSPGSEPAAQRGTLPNVYPLLLSMTWKETYRGGNDTNHTHHGRLGWESSAADGYRTKTLWARFDNKAVRFFLSSLVHNWYT
jgi:hypothetical protein